MKIFLDTAGIDEARTAARWGVLDGVTTNPSLFAKVGGSYDEVLKEICEITPGPVSAEVVADDVEGMLREGRHFAKLAANIAALEGIMLTTEAALREAPADPIINNYHLTALGQRDALVRELQLAENQEWF